MTRGPLLHDPEALAREISARLQTVRFGRPLQVVASASSTNDLARDLAGAGADEGAAVLALEQTHGRGRLGRRWASPRGGVYVSVVLRPAFPLERWPLIGLACAVGVAAAVEAHAYRPAAPVRSAGMEGIPPGSAGGPVAVKWPNDVLIGRGKVAGILVEAAGDAALCGIGVNVLQPLALSSPAEPVWLAAVNPSVSFEAVAADVLLECERRYLRLTADPAAVLGEWRRRSVTLGRRVRVEAAELLEGVAADIDDDGALLVRTVSGIRRVLAGDIVADDDAGAR